MQTETSRIISEQTRTFSCSRWAARYGRAPRPPQPGRGTAERGARCARTAW